MRRTTLKCAVLLVAIVLIVCGERWIVGAQNTALDESPPDTQTTLDTRKLTAADIARSRAEAADKAKLAMQKTEKRTAELRAQTGKSKPQFSQLSFTLSSADPQRGISGSLRDHSTRAKILFASKRDGDHLTARITDQKGSSLVEYVEAERAPVTHPITGEVTTEPVPILWVSGIVYEESRGPVADAMNQLAVSPEGELIRKLAFYLTEITPGEDLETERRGLEVPYQAMQAFYTTPGMSEYGGGELKAARLIGERRRTALIARKSQEIEAAHAGHPPLIPQPIDCERFQCVYVDTHDYQLSEQGGYVVKSLSPRLSLSHNYGRPRAHGDGDAHGQAVTPTSNLTTASSSKCGESGVITPMNDGSQVGDCYGRCGGGCGNWSHEWVGEPTVNMDMTFCESDQPIGEPGVPIDCSTMCCNNQLRRTSYSGTAVHTARGKVTVGSKAHDSCCRSIGGPCWLLSLGPCAAAALLAADCGIPGVGSEHTWSYIGPHGEGYEYYTGECCVAIGPIA